jgi:hypothetical protein
VVGNGTPGELHVGRRWSRPWRRAGIITFSCGPRPVTITMTATAKVREHQRQGRPGRRRPGDAERRRRAADPVSWTPVIRPRQWTTSHCQDQPTPALTVQNMTFADGNSTGQVITTAGAAGAIFDRGRPAHGHQLPSFTDNRCDVHRSGPGRRRDPGAEPGDEPGARPTPPVYIVDSTFTGGVCSNGGALSSIGVSWDRAQQRA